jgi:hypothetical protein
MVDLALLFGGFAKLGVAVAAEAAAQDCEHLFCGLAGGADDVGEAKEFFVASVACG